MTRTTGHLRVWILTILMATAGAVVGPPAFAADSGETITITKCPAGTIGQSVEQGCEACPLGYTSDFFREQCIEDDSWTAPPDPCQLDPARCIGPTDPTPDPDVPDGCPDEPEPTSDGSKPSCTECLKCRASQTDCFTKADQNYEECKFEAAKLATQLCLKGIQGPSEDAPRGPRHIDEFNPRNPFPWIEQMLACIHGHLEYEHKIGETVSIPYGGFWGECDARYSHNRRKVCGPSDVCAEKCRGTGIKPYSLAMDAGSIEPAPIRLVTVARPTTHDGYRVDACRFWGRDCGLLAAHQYCRNRYGKRSSAFAFELAEDIGADTPTRTLLGGEVCDQDFCDGFASITCGVDTLPWSVEAPRLEAGRLAYCDVSGTTCGETVANRFCREVFGSQSYAVRESEEEDFAGAEPTVTLDGDACAGSQCRAFLGITCRSPELLAQMIARGHDDPDGDGVPTEVDNCPVTPNSLLVGPMQEHQADRDLDGLGDACDGEPDLPTWASRNFEVQALVDQEGSPPAESQRCRLRQLPAVATWFEADLTCLDEYLEDRDDEAFALCRAESAGRLANKISTVIQRVEGHNGTCSLTGSPTALFEFVDELADRATLLHQLVLAGIDLDDPRERGVARTVIQHIAPRAGAAIRKGGMVIRGRRVRRYDALVQRLQQRLMADAEMVMADPDKRTVALHPSTLATTLLAIDRDFVDLVAGAE